jgi:hypothetical protein
LDGVDAIMQFARPPHLQHSLVVPPARYLGGNLASQYNKYYLHQVVNKKI